jgi:hypothetical protein
VLGNGARPALQLEPDPGHGEAVRVSEVDLDGLGQPDLYVLFPTDFGSDGALVQALYVHCRGDRYAPVWGPEYTLELKPLGTRTGSWLDVVRREKAGTPAAPTQKQVTLCFQGGHVRGRAPGAGAALRDRSAWPPQGASNEKEFRVTRRWVPAGRASW